MKCQNCGINYLDEDRECPICGARAGSRGRVGELEKKAAAWRERQFADEPTYQKTRTKTGAKTSTRTTTTRAKKATASVKPIREKPKGKGKVAAVIGAAVVLINILPSLAPMAKDLLQNVDGSIFSLAIDLGDWGSSEEAEVWDSYEDETVYYVPGETYEYNTDEYVSIYVRLQDIIGGSVGATLSDGTALDFEVDASGGDAYTLTLTDQTGTYIERGYYWCVYNYPEEMMNDDNYPPEQYDSMTLCLTAEQTDCDVSLHERYATRMENSDLWLLVYLDRETGVLTLEDWDDTGIFGADTFVSLNALQQG